MKINEIKPNPDFTISVVFDDGSSGVFDVKPYLDLEAFVELKNINAFNQVRNGGYFIEWACGADLSADTIVAHLTVQ
ncbi:DUF2442 domain-containing protein [bacterium]|jgi:hypothetical protein|nr:DUF2442 domain-containing protein [bacterium]MBT4292612.1 DUF2442 domain-containing protein [bacterium]MBT7310373.1 DUF2442 domain-containing protein [bacterium]